MLYRPAKKDWELLPILAATPGIPIEWVYAVYRLRADVTRRKLKRLARAVDPQIGRLNFESVVEGDGWDMLLAIPTNYSGAVPLFSQLELQNDRRPARVLAEILGVTASKVYYWQKNTVFDPLTGVRLVPGRGGLCL